MPPGCRQAGGAFSWFLMWEGRVHGGVPSGKGSCHQAWLRHFDSQDHVKMEGEKTGLQKVVLWLHKCLRQICSTQIKKGREWGDKTKEKDKTTLRYYNHVWSTRIKAGQQRCHLTMNHGQRKPTPCPLQAAPQKGQSQHCTDNIKTGAVPAQLITACKMKGRGRRDEQHLTLTLPFCGRRESALAGCPLPSHVHHSMHASKLTYASQTL